MVNAIDIVNMQTEYLNEPLGIDVVQPRFSYQITSTAALRGLSQKSYLIRPPLTSPLTIERKEKRNKKRKEKRKEKKRKERTLCVNKYGFNSVDLFLLKMIFLRQGEFEHTNTLTL